jgi:hypothetical protein
MISITWFNISLACRFGISWATDIVSAICRRVRTALAVFVADVAGFLPDFAADFAGAFAALVALAAVVERAEAPRAAPLPDAAFLDVVFVGVLAMEPPFLHDWPNKLLT